MISAYGTIKAVKAKARTLGMIAGVVIFAHGRRLMAFGDKPTDGVNAFGHTKMLMNGSMGKEINMAGQKYDNAKPRFSLIPDSALWQVMAVLEFEADKYGQDNWRNITNAHEWYFNACHHHLNAWWQGEGVYDKSGLPHLAHATCCLLFLMAVNNDD